MHFCLPSVLKGLFQLSFFVFGNGFGLMYLVEKSLAWCPNQSSGQDIATNIKSCHDSKKAQNELQDMQHMENLSRGIIWSVRSISQYFSVWNAPNSLHFPDQGCFNSSLQTSPPPQIRKQSQLMRGDLSIARGPRCTMSLIGIVPVEPRHWIRRWNYHPVSISNSWYQAWSWCSHSTPLSFSRMSNIERTTSKADSIGVDHKETILAVEVAEESNTTVWKLLRENVRVIIFTWFANCGAFLFGYDVLVQGAINALPMFS